MRWFVEAVREGVRPLFEQLLADLTPPVPVAVYVGDQVLSVAPTEENSGMLVPGGVATAGPGMLVQEFFLKHDGTKERRALQVVRPCSVIAFNGKLVAVVDLDAWRSLSNLLRGPR